MTLDDFLDKLEGVKTGGTGWVAVCPAHDDREASLGVTEGDDARILITCHAGCATTDVVEAMGLRMSDLFARTTNYAEPDAIYSYTDEGGVELFQAVRLPGKQFRQRTLGADGEWIWKLEGVRRVLYRLPEVIAGVAAGRTVYVTEGEKDAESIIATGHVATCNPMGAGKWRDEFVPFLRGANVIIVADRDEPGRAHADRVRQSLVGVAKAIYVFQARRGKDVTDHLELGLALEELVPIRQPTRRGITTAYDLAEEGLEYLDARESDLPAYRMIEGLPINLRAGRMYALGAYTGDGKTTFCLQATRRLCMEGRHGGYFSFEMSAADLRNRLLAHRGIPISLTEKPWTIRADTQLRAKYEEALEEIRGWNLDVIFKTDTDAAYAAETARDREYDFVVIDHIHRTPGDRQRLTEEVQRYTNLALELNIPVIIVCQLRKYERGKGAVVFPEPTIQDFRETSQIADDSSMALGLWRVRNATGFGFVGNQTKLTIFKNRHTTGGTDAPGHAFFMGFDSKTQLYSVGGAPNVQDDAELRHDPDPGAPGEAGGGSEWWKMAD